MPCEILNLNNASSFLNNASSDVYEVLFFAAPIPFFAKLYSNPKPLNGFGCDYHFRIAWFFSKLLGCIIIIIYSKSPVGQLVSLILKLRSKHAEKSLCL